MARPKVKQEIFLISVSTFVYCSSNPIYAGVCRVYDIAAILDKIYLKVWPLTMGSVAFLQMAPA